MGVSHAERWGRAITGLHPSRMGALPLVLPILQALQVAPLTNALVPNRSTVDDGRIVVLLILNRLLAPQPLYRVQDWLADTVLPEVLGLSAQHVYDNRLGRTLDRLHPHLGELWARLAGGAIRVYDLDLSVLHWDITSIYFEGAYTDSALATYGYSRDHRPDTKQLNLEADVTHDGQVPILYQTLPGNTADITRPVAHLEALLRFLGRPELRGRHWHPLLVSDGKMISPEAVRACHDHDLYYLGPLPDGKATEALLRSVTATELAAHPLAYRPQRVPPGDAAFVPYQGVWRPVTFAHGDQRFTDRALVVWSAGKERLDAQKGKTYLKRLLNGLAAIQKKLNAGRYRRRAYVEQRLAALQRDHRCQGLVDIALHGTDDAMELTFRVNRQRLAEVQALNGRYALVTNAGHLDATEALTLYKGQDGVEKRFGALKGPLVVHPLLVRTDRRIEGLVFISLVALLVRAVLERACRQRGLPLTASRLFQGFDGLQAVDVVWRDGSRQRRMGPTTAFQERVLRALNWPWPETYASGALTLT